jgi:hypothetical protein
MCAPALEVQSRPRVPPRPPPLCIDWLSFAGSESPDTAIHRLSIWDPRCGWAAAACGRAQQSLGPLDHCVVMPRPREIPDQLRGRPFTRTEAIQWGVTGAMLRGKRFRRIFTGVYVEDRVPDSEALRFDAVRLIAPAAGRRVTRRQGFTDCRCHLSR